jgi:hypothetical protein
VQKSVPDLTACDYILANTIDIVHSRFVRDPLIGFEEELIWDVNITEASATILGVVAPARTNPLGQVSVTGAKINNIVLEQFTDSNYDHSAQFHGYYSEKRDNVPFRARYWNQLLIPSVGSYAVSRYSGLYNGL